MMKLYFSIFLSYILLLIISKIFDPRSKGTIMMKKWSIYNIVGFAAFKIVFASSPFLITVYFTGIQYKKALGLSGITINSQAFLNGLLVAVIFFIINVTWNQISSKIPFFEKEESKDTEKLLISKLPKKRKTLIFTLILISFQAGLMEELFFRGIIQSNISSLLFPYGSVILTAILFGAAHFYQGFNGIINTFLLGFLLSLSFKISGNIIVPIMGHFLGDLICMLSGLPEIMKNLSMSDS